MENFKYEEVFVKKQQRKKVELVASAKKQIFIYM